MCLLLIIYDFKFAFNYLYDFKFLKLFSNEIMLIDG